jgi:hypothetical protein
MSISPKMKMSKFRSNITETSDKFAQECRPINLELKLKYWSGTKEKRGNKS